MDAAGRWARIEREWMARPGIGSKKMLQSAGLTGSSGKVFASLVDDRLVVKLPASRVDELAEAGLAERFRSGRREMREWASVAPEHERRWAGLVDEAHAFVNPER